MEYEDDLDEVRNGYHYLLVGKIHMTLYSTSEMHKSDIQNAYFISHDIFREGISNRADPPDQSHSNLVRVQADLGYIPNVRRSLLCFEQDKVVQMVILIAIRNTMVDTARFFCLFALFGHETDRAVIGRQMVCCKA